MSIVKRFASEDYVKNEIQTELEKIDSKLDAYW